jgi:uncharacterized membrane protein YvbJ
MYCKKCGEKNNQEAEYCPGYGTKLRQDIHAKEFFESGTTDKSSNL